MAAPRNGKKSTGAAPKKKSAKAAPLATPVEPTEAVVEATPEVPAEPVAEVPFELAGDPVEPVEEPAFDLPAEEPAAAAVTNEATLDLHGVEERLPWLESDDDFDKDEGDGGRVAGFMLGGLLALALIVGGIWWVAHREKHEEVADGGVIEAPVVAYKEAPKNPGGKQFEGTGDSSFAVSEGQTRPARLGEETPGAKPSPTPSASASASPKPTASAAATDTAAQGGVGVQIAAFTSKSTAEAGWTRLQGQYAALKGVSHRVVEGKADIGTVYRLQAVAGDVATANALCGKLKAEGGACQVKR